MDKELLAKAIAALLPSVNKQIDIKETFDLFKWDLPRLPALSFECHKALIGRCCEHGCTRIDNYWQYNYGDINSEGEAHEEAIFNAVLDWFRKEG